ncbi:MAG: hypothetical protein L6Q33_06455 [Bacteriovoracaceae bacterium]|nr:hypothetical protein [Bacteriovoracaceae bacterium]
MKAGILLFIALLFQQSVLAEGNQLGFILGAPTGISAKKELGNDRAVDAALAYSLRKEESLVIHANYLFENQFAFHIQDLATLNLYYGIGGRFAFIDEGKDKDKIAIGPRAPIGLTYDFAQVPVQTFVELSATLDLIPDTDVDFDAGIGARIKF